MADEIITIKVSEYGSSSDEPWLEITKWSEGIARFKIQRDIKRLSNNITKTKSQEDKAQYTIQIKSLELLLAFIETLG